MTDINQNITYRYVLISYNPETKLVGIAKQECQLDGDTIVNYELLETYEVASLDEVPGLAGDNKTELQTHVDAFKSEVENSLITELQK